MIRNELGRESESAALPTASDRDFALAKVEQGIAAEACGEIAKALQCYREAVKADPSCAYAEMSLGIALSSGGDPASAIVAYAKAIELDPKLAAAHYNLALAFLETSANVQAVVEFQAALALRSNFPEAWVGLADALESVGDEVGALAALDKAIEQQPNYVGALFNASMLLRKCGQVEKAKRRLSEIDLEALFATGRHTETEDLARHVTEFVPDNGMGWKVLGAVMAVQRKFEAAVAALGRASTMLPNDPETHHNLAISLQALARYAQAETEYRLCIKLKPGYVEAHANLANVLVSLNRLAEAETSCRRALALKPDFYKAHSDLGLILEAQGRPVEAISSYRRALDLNPSHHVAYNNLAASLVTMGRLAEAESSCLSALEFKQDYREGHDNLLFLLNYHPDKSPDEVYSAYSSFETVFGKPLQRAWRPHMNDRRPDRRLRIGYVSPDFRRHAASHFVEPLLAHHDKSAFEIFAYAEVGLEDEVSARMRLLVDRWTSTCGMDDDQLADRIRADGIDILVDLAGHTRGNRLLVFARKPAPVSVTTIGFGYTTGLTSIDWFLTDEIVVPMGAEGVFSEKPWRIPLCQVYRGTSDMGPTNALPALTRGYVTFGALTRAARINHRVVRVWSAILQRVPRSKLRIDSLNFGSKEVCEEFAHRFQAHGIGPERLEMGFHSPPWDVMRNIDVTLDCFPQNSGTTLFESVYMGLPFITLADRISLGRLGASIAAHTGHQEWIAATEDDYVEKAVGLVADLQSLSSLRARLRKEVLDGPLMDERSYVGHVETAFREMWRNWSAS